MAGANTLSSLNGLFKEVYGDLYNQLYPCHVIQRGSFINTQKIDNTLYYSKLGRILYWNDTKYKPMEE